MLASIATFSLIFLSFPHYFVLLSPFDTFKSCQLHSAVSNFTDISSAIMCLTTGIWNVFFPRSAYKRVAKKSIHRKRVVLVTWYQFNKCRITNQLAFFGEFFTTFRKNVSARVTLTIGFTFSLERRWLATLN